MESIKKNPIGTCPFHKIFPEAGPSSVKLNLRGALLASLELNYPIREVVETNVSKFGTYTESEQNSIIKYVLVADILKRGLWDKIQRELHDYLSELVNPNMLAELYKSMEASSIGQSDPWSSSVNFVYKLVASKTKTLLIAWNKKMSGKVNAKYYDPIEERRYAELYHMLNDDSEAVLHLMVSGYGTGISYPLDLLKCIPNLLQANGEDSGQQRIKNVFFRNLKSLASASASTDLITFDSIDFFLKGNDYNTHYTPNDFILNQDDILEVKASSLPEIHKFHSENLAKKYPADERVVVKQCPAMFADIIKNNYVNFFKPIINTILNVNRMLETKFVEVKPL